MSESITTAGKARTASEYVPGERVSWVAVHGAYRRDRSGVVIAVVRRGQNARASLPADASLGSLDTGRDIDPYNDRLVVELDRVPGKKRCFYAIVPPGIARDCRWAPAKQNHAIDTKQDSDAARRPSAGCACGHGNRWHQNFGARACQAVVSRAGNLEACPCKGHTRRGGRA